MKGQRAYPSSYLPPAEAVRVFTEGLKRLKREENMATRLRTGRGKINPSPPTDVPPKVEDAPEWDGGRHYPMRYLTLMDAMTLRTVRRANAIYLGTRDRLMAAMRETR